jgi:hypothetical protein
VIERFNFYDIYGYFVPGLVLVGMIWLPFGLLHGLPQQDFSSTFIVVLFAYIAGHLIQELAATLPRTVKDKAGRDREHSDRLLDAGDDTLAQPLKDRISELTLKHFKLDLTISGDPATISDEERKRIAHLRSVAFFQARSLLVQDHRQSYGEQFQGLYSMMRGLTVSFAAATAYFLGWAVAYRDNAAGPVELAARDKLIGWIPATLLVVVAASLVLAFILGAKAGNDDAPATWTQVLAGCLAIAVFCGAALVARNTSPESGHHVGNFALLLTALVSGVAALRCYGAYRSFAREFALAVWREFANFEELVPMPPMPMMPPNA